MSKSRYSKTKAAGLLCGMSRYRKQYEFKSRSNTGADIQTVNNRQIRRLKQNGK